MSKEVFLHFSHRFLSMSVSPRAGEENVHSILTRIPWPELKSISHISLGSCLDSDVGLWRDPFVKAVGLRPGGSSGRRRLAAIAQPGGFQTLSLRFLGAADTP